MTAGLPSFETHIFIRLPGKGAIAPFNVPFFSANMPLQIARYVFCNLPSSLCLESLAAAARCLANSTMPLVSRSQPAYAVNFHLLSVLPKIIGKLIGQRILIMTMRRMYCHTGWFIHCDHIRIFIENVRHLFKGQQMCGALLFVSSKTSSTSAF